jgi:hypothetical protein
VQQAFPVLGDRRANRLLDTVVIDLHLICRTAAPDEVGGAQPVQQHPRTRCEPGRLEHETWRHGPAAQGQHLEKIAGVRRQFPQRFEQHTRQRRLARPSRGDA